MLREKVAVHKIMNFLSGMTRKEYWMSHSILFGSQMMFVIIFGYIVYLFGGLFAQVDALVMLLVFLFFGFSLFFLASFVSTLFIDVKGASFLTNVLLGFSTLGFALGQMFLFTPTNPYGVLLFLLSPIAFARAIAVSVDAALTEETVPFSGFQ